MSIHLRLDLVDRLAAEVRRGLAAGSTMTAHPGEEVGGILIGTVQNGYRTIIRIDDFEPVESAHRAGPAFLLSEDDEAAFGDACRQWQPAFSPHAYAIGYYRSHLRDGFGLVAADEELLDRFLPDPQPLALLIRPATGRASTGAFVVGENGVFSKAAPTEFPLRRSTLAGAPTVQAEQSPRIEPAVNIETETDLHPQGTVPTNRGAWSRVMWLPLSLACLLIGGMLGFEAGLTIGSRSNGSPAEVFSLALSVARNHDNLNVTWNRRSAAIQLAQKAVLEIEDGGYAKPVDLDAAQLRNGTLIYRNSSNSVRFRLTVYPYGRVSVTETFAWKQ